MSRVSELPGNPVRAIAIRRSDDAPHRILVGAFEVGRNGAKNRFIGTPETPPTFAAAWEVAARLRKATGLPILDLISPRPAGPGTGARMAA